MASIVHTNPDYAWRARTREVVGEPELTSREVADAAGVDLEDARRVWRALGFPPVPEDRPFFNANDVTMLRSLHALRAGGPHDDAMGMQLTRVTGQAFARLAEAQVASLFDRLERARAAGELDAPVDDALWNGMNGLLPIFEPFLSYVWRRHLAAAVWRRSLAAASPGTEQSLVVGFADLVNFTATSAALDEVELATMVDRFEMRVFDHVPEHRGRVIKMIGDEVMFCTEHVSDAIAIAFALIDAHQEDPALPDIRVGLAMGPTLSWLGDLFGPTVNRASRVVNIARPATVLVSEELVAAVRADARYTVRELRAIRLRGIGKVRLGVVRRS